LAKLKSRHNLVGSPQTGVSSWLLKIKNNSLLELCTN
jgi:hypothetical protein